MRTGILSFTSDENNVQLISMRALSGLWDWVALDEMKQVNLRLPDERVPHTYLGYVPYPLASLPADEARRVLKGVSLEAFGFARDEQNMIGQVFFENRQTGRSPSAANIDT